MPPTDYPLRNNAMVAANPATAIGVGLRHPHFKEALSGASSIDFVEIHAENFFAEGGVALSLLDQISDIYPISLHATSMGLGSAVGVSPAYLCHLKQLIDRIDPWLVSDHACFTWSHAPWSTAADKRIHAGDLLPLEFSRRGLDVIATNVDRIQQLLGRPILVENISSYIAPEHATMSEPEFLCALVDRTHCKLLIDLNNLLVNAQNFSRDPPLTAVRQWLQCIPSEAVGELHLAGSSPASSQSLVIDDHAAAVSIECWALYQFALQRFGAKPTLIEWDNNLPSWNELLEQAALARDWANTIHPGQQKRQ